MIREQVFLSLIEDDPIRLAESCGFPPLVPFHHQVLEWNPDEGKDLHLTATRQGGKSQTAAIKGLHFALTRLNSTVMVLSPSFEQSGETFIKVRRAFGVLNLKTIKAEKKTERALHLSNGSRVVCKTSNESVRGYSVDLLIIDEASRVPDSTYDSILPALAATNGRQLLSSTPAGREGFFFKVKENGSPERWLMVEAPATECSALIPPERLEEYRELYPPWYFKQEFLCSFEHAGGSKVFSEEALANLLSSEAKPLRTDLTFEQSIRRSRRGILYG